MTKLVKSRYFPRIDFLNAEMPANPSYMWRSIMSAKEVIKAGCRRRIEDGEATKVWKIPWLPCTENGCVTTPMIPELQDITVSNLVDTNTIYWDFDILNELFNDRDKRLIQRIPIPSQRRRDTWFWLLD